MISVTVFTNRDFCYQLKIKKEGGHVRKLRNVEKL